jgi:hypothetical protein
MAREVLKQRSVDDLGNGVSARELVDRMAKVVPGLYIAEAYGTPGNPAITSLRQRMVGEDARRAFDSMDVDSKQIDNYLTPLYRGVLPEHDLWSSDGKKPLIYGWRHVLLLVANQCKVSLRDLEAATGLHVYD